MEDYNSAHLVRTCAMVAVVSAAVILCSILFAISASVVRDIAMIVCWVTRFMRRAAGCVLIVSLFILCAITFWKSMLDSLGKQHITQANARMMVMIGMNAIQRMP